MAQWEAAAATMLTNFAKLLVISPTAAHFSEQ
jgi:hypothetical protein